MRWVPIQVTRFIVAIIAVGVAVALALVFTLGRSKKAERGAQSADALVRATMKAIEEGDAQGLIRLTAPTEVLRSLTDCAFLVDPTDDSEAELGWMRDIRRTRNKELAVESFRSIDDGTVKNGDRDGDICAYKREHSIHLLAVELANGDDSVRINAMKIDGRWFLRTITGLPTRSLTAEEQEQELRLEAERRAKVRSKLRDNRAPLPSSVGSSSPTQAVTELLRAVQKRDVATIAKLLPARPVVDLVLDCNPSSKLMGDLEALLFRVVQEVEATFEVEASQLVGSTQLQSGSSLKGCKVADRATFAEVKILLEAKTLGQKLELVVEALQIRGRWFLIAMRKQ